MATTTTVQRQYSSCEPPRGELLEQTTMTNTTYAAQYIIVVLAKKFNGFLRSFSDLSNVFTMHFSSSGCRYNRATLDGSRLETGGSGMEVLMTGIFVPVCDEGNLMH